MKFIYPAVFRKKEDGGYDAHFPDLECCEAYGETLDDAIDNANEAARTWITVELEEEDPIFPHVSDLEDIELAEDEIVTAEDYEVEAGTGFDVKSDFSGMKIHPERVKVTYHEAKNQNGQAFDAVSYTHLTLPTILRV